MLTSSRVSMHYHRSGLQNFYNHKICWGTQWSQYLLWQRSPASSWSWWWTSTWSPWSPWLVTRQSVTRTRCVSWTHTHTAADYATTEHAGGRTDGSYDTGRGKVAGGDGVKIQYSVGGGRSRRAETGRGFLWRVPPSPLAPAPARCATSW